MKSFIHKLFRKKKKLITHSGSFHADDIFAAATLSIYLKREGIPFEIIRTRDEELIIRGDYVFDIGGVYNPDLNRFDHHQEGGAGKRENGIPYAAFGLVWKKFGPKLCQGNLRVSDEIDRKLVQLIDAIDNGVNLSKTTYFYEGIYDYGIHSIIAAYHNTWDNALDEKERYQNFIYLVSFFEDLLIHEIHGTEKRFEILELIEESYRKSENKEIIEVPYHIGVSEMVQALHKYKEVLFVVAKSNKHWKVMAMRKDPSSFSNRKSLPASWAGKRDKELQEATGVSDAIFCHNERWLAIAKTRLGAKQLAELALLGD